MIGGAGSDWLAAGNGNDIVIGGATIYDDDNAALDAVMSEWNGRGRYRDKIDTIRTGGGDLNGVKLEAGSTVLNDGATDYLIGQNGSDWFFGQTSGAGADQIFARFNEVVDALP